MVRAPIATHSALIGQAPHALLAVLLFLLALLLPAEGAHAAPSPKKAIWGPVVRDGVDQFPIYRDLGVGIYEAKVSWAAVARRRPAHPTNPADPAYSWPSGIDQAVREAPGYGIAVSLLVMDSPRWANGGRGPQFAPPNPHDYSKFIQAAARHYPAVHHWMIWGEPTKPSDFEPQGRAGARLYARILDAAYGRLKAISRRNLVIGGDTYTVGATPPLRFVRMLRLPSGRPPRMDLYGHNPFSAREPRFGQSPLGGGSVDFSDLPLLERAVNRQLARPRHKRRLRLFLSEFTLPTDHTNFEFNFYLTRAVQARWLGDALRITRRTSWIYTLGYLALYDDALRPDGQQVERGLLDRQGLPKPAFAVYRRG